MNARETKSQRAPAWFPALVACLLASITASGIGGAAEPPVAQVLFVCEHGNVKSLMAASYFNRMAAERNLPLRAISRGTDITSDEVPAKIASQLGNEGFDVSNYRPMEVSPRDVVTSDRIVLIGAQIEETAGMDAASGKIERWNDIPPASTGFTASREAMQARISALLDQFAGAKPP